MSTPINLDSALQSWMGWMIDLTDKKPLRYTWKKGEKLKLLFAGYSGTRNTGADVRVTEMIRQISHILGEDQVDLSIVTVHPEQSKNYFPNTKQVRIPKIFPPFLYQECPKHHGVIACEGSMFKSKFADALSTMMAGSLGMANIQNKLSIGYGAEAGQMSPSLQRFVEKQCKDSLIVCRNEKSQEILQNMNIRTKPGTDTAWTYPIPDKEIGKTLLMQNGWDGKTPVLIICPIDPFCWPVKPNFNKTIRRLLLNEHQEDHYESIYFHEINEQSRNKFDTYTSAIANAVNRLYFDVFTVLVGMEKLDRKACMAVNEKLNTKAPMFISDKHDIDEMVSILHQGSMLLSSRFHAIVCSMTGLVPSAGITMDERIENLLTERDHKELLLYVDEKNLEDKIYTILQTLHNDKDAIQSKIKQMIAREIQKMGQMGMDLKAEVIRVYPEFTPKITSNQWKDYLPPLSKQTQDLL